MCCSLVLLLDGVVVGDELTCRLSGKPRYLTPIKLLLLAEVFAVVLGGVRVDRCRLRVASPCPLSGALRHDRFDGEPVAVLALALLLLCEASVSRFVVPLAESRPADCCSWGDRGFWRLWAARKGSW